MNRHKLYWSIMGVEPKQEKSVKQEDFEKFEKHILIMIGKYGSTDMLSCVRETYEKSLKVGD